MGEPGGHSLSTSFKTHGTLLAVAAIPLLLRLGTAGIYGIFRDKYYYLACARHLAWGYVDQPPLSIALLTIIRVVFGEAVLALRIVPAFCPGALVLLAGATAAKLGGGRFAQLLAGLSMSIVGVVQVITGFYSMDALDLAIWVARGPQELRRNIRNFI